METTKTPNDTAARHQPVPLMKALVPVFIYIGIMLVLSVGMHSADLDARELPNLAQGLLAFLSLIAALSVLIFITGMPTNLRQAQWSVQAIKYVSIMAVGLAFLHGMNALGLFGELVEITYLPEILGIIAIALYVLDKKRIK